MKICKKAIVMLLAVLMCFSNIQIHAYADALPAEDAWFISGSHYYVVNSSGVYGYTWQYVFDGGPQEIEYALSYGDVVYAKCAVNRMGITWAGCSSEEEHEPGSIYYGWVDMAYLTPYDEYYAPEPETEPSTEPPTTIKATTKATTRATTVLTTIVTTKKTTVKTTTKAETTSEKAVMAAVDNDDDSRNGKSSSVSLPLLLIAAVVVLLALSAIMAIVLLNRKKKTIYPSNMQYNQQAAQEQTQGGVKYCPKCGNQLK